MSEDVSYRTHVLIGVRHDGVMSVIAHWPQVPTLTEVEQEIQGVRHGHTTFMLCTPTAILPAEGSGEDDGRFGFQPRS